MASIISAGTTDSTSLNVSGDKSGILQLASNNATVAVTINTSQYVGIGDTNPQSSLSVNSTTNPQIRVAYTGVHTYGLKVSSGGNFSIQDTDASSTDRLTIDTSGNVGIGTTSPSSYGKLVSYAGDIAAVKAHGSGSYPTLVFQNATAGTTFSGRVLWKDGNGNAGWNVGQNVAVGSGYLEFNDGSTNRMAIDSGGSVMIGTTSPGGRLTVAGPDSSGSNNALYVKNANNNLLFQARDDGWINLGNASVSPYNNTTPNGANMYIATDASVQRSTSSLKYKKNIVDARYGLADVLKLRAVNYQSKNDFDGDKLFGGLIAEEVEEAGLTEFVQYSSDGTPDALAYGQMVAMAFKAIQEQQTIINALTARIEALENK